MKGTADFHSKVEISLAKDDPADANGRAIDCFGAHEALPFVVQATLGGTDPTNDVKWAESPDGSTSWADITGAAHDQILIDDNKVVTVVDLANEVLTLAAQPASPSRLLITIVDTTPSITAGTVYIVGTRPPQQGEQGSQAATEIVDCSGGAGAYRTTTIFDAVTSITNGVVAGVSARGAVQHDQPQALPAGRGGQGRHVSHGRVRGRVGALAAEVPARGAHRPLGVRDRLRDFLGLTRGSGSAPGLRPSPP
jgi:hypothetical protein